jgi:hypothetical protein
MPIRLVALTQSVKKAKPQPAARAMPEPPTAEPDMEEIMAIMKEEIEAWEDEIILTRWQRFKIWIKDLLHVS